MFDEQHWYRVRDGDSRARALYLRHYSASQTAIDKGLAVWGYDCTFVGSGDNLLLLTSDASAVFVWKRFPHVKSDDHRGINNSLFRNESRVLSSVLIREAVELAWQKWPGERLFTFVDSHKIKSSNPGFCYLKAGWRRLPNRTKSNDLTILEYTPDMHAQQGGKP